MHHRFIPGAIAALLLLTAAAPTPPAAFANFSGAGKFGVKMTPAAGKTMSVDAQMRIAHKNMLTRIEVLSAAFSMTDADMNMSMGPISPTGRISIVVDQSKQQFTMWSSAHALYYQSKFSMSTLKSKMPSKARTSDPMSMIAGALTSMTKFDVYSSSFELTGHQLTNGHMSSIFTFTHKSQVHGQKLQTANGTVALADDFSGIPVHIDSTMDGPMSGSMSADLTSVSRSVPAQSEFSPPKNYKKTNNMMAILMNQGRMTMPVTTRPEPTAMPSTTPSPSASPR